LSASAKHTCSPFLTTSLHCFRTSLYRFAFSFASLSAPLLSAIAFFPPFLDRKVFLLFAWVSLSPFLFRSFCSPLFRLDTLTLSFRVNKYADVSVSRPSLQARLYSFSFFLCFHLPPFLLFFSNFFPCASFFPCLSFSLPSYEFLTSTLAVADVLSRFSLIPCLPSSQSHVKPLPSLCPSSSEILRTS